MAATRNRTVGGQDAPVRDRSWTSLVLVVLAAGVAFLAYRWGVGDAAEQGADEQLQRAAGLLVAGAAAIGVIALGSVLLTLLLPTPGRRASRAVALVLGIVLFLGAVALYLLVLPLLLEQV